jgi:hypothetical protein
VFALGRSSKAAGSIPRSADEDHAKTGGAITMSAPTDLQQLRSRNLRQGVNAVRLSLAKVVPQSDAGAAQKSEDLNLVASPAVAGALATSWRDWVSFRPSSPDAEIGAGPDMCSRLSRLFWEFSIALITWP